MSGSCGWFPMRHEEIVAWVDAHRDSLPATLAELSRFPVPFRKVIAKVVATGTRLGWWREHLTACASEHDLSDDQRAFIAGTIDVLPELFAAPAPNPTILDWESRAARLFTRQEAGRIFGTLGPREPPEGLPLPIDAVPSGR